MKKIYTYIFIVLVLIHAYFLYKYGISTFITTCLFYYIIYLIIKKLLSFIKRENTRVIIQKNIKTVMVIMLIIEFVMTFILKAVNTFMENEKGIYFSEFMRQPQVDLLHFLGWKNVQLSWETGYKPNTKRIHQTDEFSYSYITNSSGMRGELPDIEKRKDEFRVVVLGDSFIEGYGSPNDSTFPILLQNQLNTESQKMKVINAGICGSNPLYEINLYHNKLQKYKPDLILLQTSILDLEDINYAVNQNKMPVSEYLFAISHIIRGIYAGVENNNKINDVELKRKENINLIVHHLSKFNQEINKLCNFVVIILPALNKTYHVVEKESITEQYKNALLKSKIDIIDLQKEYKIISFMHKDRLNRYYWQKDGHHTSEGYLLMSRIVAKQLIEKNYVRIN